MGKSSSHVLRLTEVSLAVNDVDDAVRDICEMLAVGADPVLTDSAPPIQSRFASFQTPGEAKFGVMSSTEAGSPIDRFLQRRGEGFFSISLQVDDIQATMADWQAKGGKFVLDEPMVIHNSRVGGRQWREIQVNFTRPSAKLHGLVIEIQELRD